MTAPTATSDPSAPSAPLTANALSPSGAALLSSWLDEEFDGSRDYQNQQLHDAISSNKPQEARLALSRGASPHAPNYQNLTPLQLACLSEATECAELLLSVGAQIDAAAPNGNTALFLCFYKGFGAGAQLLIDKGADINRLNNRGESPLCAALSGLSPPPCDCALALIRAGAAINHLYKPPRSKKRPLLFSAVHLAVLNGREACLRELLERGASPRGTCGSLPSPLNCVAQASSLFSQTIIVACAKLLISAGARLETRSFYDGAEGQTPLLSALARNRPELARALLDAGATVLAQDRVGRSALTMAGYHSDNAMIDEIVERKRALNERSSLAQELPAAKELRKPRPRM